MQLLNILLCAGLVFLPIIGYVLISENKIKIKSFLPALIIVGVVLVLFFIAMFATDFHTSAIILQLLLPSIIIVSAIVLVVWGLSVLIEKGFFKGKLLILTLSVLAVLIIVLGRVAFYKLQSKKIDYSKYPDIEFSGTYHANGDKKKVTVHWESSDNTFTNTSVKDSDSETDEPYKMPDTVSGEEINVEELYYNLDETAAYYSNDNRIFRYTPENNSYVLIGAAPAEDDDHFYIKKICVSDDEKNIYFIAGEYRNEDVNKYLYCLDASTGESSVIMREDGWIQDFEITPDGKSIIYNRYNKIGKFDIASRKTTMLLESTDVDDRDNGGDHIIRISEDGRYIMFYSNRVPIMCSQIFVFDTKTGTTERVIKTNKYLIHDVDWEKG